MSSFDISRHILFEDASILLMDKLAGLMVEPDRNNNKNLLTEVREYLKSANVPEIYAQHIHRLDRPVRGIVLFAKQRAVLKNLSEQFAERRVKKFYRALTDKAPDTWKGKLEHWHRKEKKKAVLYDAEIQYAEKSILEYTVYELPGQTFLWDIELHTGKYHQIRAQLSYIGCPILGDAVYGSAVSYKPDCIALEAYRLIFLHPVTHQELDIQLPSTGSQDFNRAL